MQTTSQNILNTETPPYLTAKIFMLAEYRLTGLGREF